METISGMSTTAGAAPKAAPPPPGPTAAPNPTPKAEENAQTSVPATAPVTAPESATKDTKNDADKNSPITKQGNDEAHTFTAADDAKLIEMKAAGKTWKEIVAETKKSQSALKERYKEIAAKPDASTAGGGSAENEKDSEAKAEEDKKEADAKAAEEEKKNAEGQCQQASSTSKGSKKDKSNASEKTAKVITLAHLSCSSKFGFPPHSPLTVSLRSSQQPAASPRNLHQTPPPAAQHLHPPLK